MSSPFWFDKQSHVTRVVNIWRQNQLSRVSPNSRSACIGSISARPSSEHFAFETFFSFCRQLTQAPKSGTRSRWHRSTSDLRGAASLCTRAEITVFITGSPGSVIVPQYSSSKITAFVWGKNTILKFVGNMSMRLTLQLVVVVVNVQMKFSDNLLKFTLQTI